MPAAVVSAGAPSRRGWWSSGARPHAGTVPPLKFALVAWLVGAIAITTAPIVGDLPGWLLLGLIAAGTARLVLAWRGIAVPQMPLVLILALAGAVTAGLYFGGHFGFGLDLATPGLVAFVWIKLFEQHSQRDVLMVCIYGLFLVTVQLLSAQGPWTTGYALLAAAAVFAALARYHAEAAGARAPGRGSVVTGALLVAQALPFALILFICVPRPPAPGIDTRSGISGLTDHLDPFSIDHLAQSQEPAFRVEFAAGQRPLPARCYWRGLVLGATDGTTWTRTNAESGARATEPEHEPLPRGAVERSYTVDQQPHDGRWVYTLDSAVRPVPGMVARIGRVYERVGSNAVSNTYEAVSAIEASPIDRPAPGDHTYLRYPGRDLDPRIVALAQGWKRKAAGDPAVVVAQAEAWYKAQGFVYTLDPGAQPGPNPVATFLFEGRRGFCSHYAAATALLLRIAGVPTRVVIGYYGGEINPLGDFITVRQANAHAWDEWWDGNAWQRLDATAWVPAVDDRGDPLSDGDRADPDAFASSRRGNGFFARLARRISYWNDYVEAQWDRWILGYDHDTFLALLAWLHLDRFGIFAPLILLALGVLPAAGFTWMTLRRRARDPVVALWAGHCARLAAIGLPRAPAEGPMAYTSRVAAQAPGHAVALARVATVYAACRFGPPGAKPPLGELARAVRACRLRRGDVLADPLAGRGVP
jgi:transglutaminase-like putative cysteine protease